MKRVIAGFPAAVFALGALATTAAADVAGAEPAAQAPPSSPLLAQNSTAAAAPGAELSQVAGSTSTSYKVVCLSVSLQCFRAASATPGASSSAPKTLDLRAPDIRTLVSEAELRERVEDEWAIREREQEQQVRVEAARPEVYVPGGIASLPWAIRHPTQAWRIFLPVPQAK